MARDVFVDCRETLPMAVGRFRGTRRRAASVTSESLVFKRRLACIHGEAVNRRQENASKLKKTVALEADNRQEWKWDRFTPMEWKPLQESSPASVVPPPVLAQLSDGWSVPNCFVT
jgi:hypothetical protein